MITPLEIATSLAAVLAIVLIGLATHKLKRTKGRNLVYHGAFVACAAVVVLLFPASVQQVIFHPIGVIAVGVIFPIYESIRAVCTPATQDDMEWLQYWCAQAAVYFAGSYIQDYIDTSSQVAFHFRQFEFIFFVWLFLPFTDGSTLVFEYFTQPVLAPIIKPAASKMSGWINGVVNMFINASHLWLVWAFFILLPAFVKRFAVIAVGSIYPTLVSVVAVTTDDKDDDTFWLTYWSCYGSMFLIVDSVDQWVGRIPGFYIVVLFTTVYLMLPMFEGAERAFRHILVPLAGLREMLLLRDAVKVKKELIKSLPPERQAAVRRAIVQSFNEEGEEAIHALAEGRPEASATASLLPV